MDSSLTIKVIPYPKSREDMLDALEVRYAVFIDEQKFEYDLEEDGQDSKSIHIVLYKDNKPIGTVRIIPLKPILKLSRLCILKEYRKKGLSKYLMEEHIKRSREMKDQGFEKIFLESQIQVAGLYEKYGFVTTSGVVMVEDYPHKNMELLL